MLIESLLLLNQLILIGTCIHSSQFYAVTTVDVASDDGSIIIGNLQIFNNFCSVQAEHLKCSLEIYYFRTFPACFLFLTLILEK